jgi:hypothetical protein
MLRYLITQDLLSTGGRNLLDKYDWSPSLLLSNVYKEHEWLPWKFAVCPQNFWDDKINQKKFLDWLGKQLKIKHLSDWYNVSLKVL